MKKIQEIFNETNRNCIFVPKTHEYYYLDENNDHIYLTSVTKWLGDLFFKETGEVFNAPKVAKEISKNPNSEYFGLDPSYIMSLWSKHAGRGTRKHSQIEKWLNGEIPHIKESEWLIKNNLVPSRVFSEVRLYSPEYGL